MGRILRRFRTEWIPRSGYVSFEEPRLNLSQYINDYYNRHRPHTHNGGLSPLMADQRYEETYNGLASFS